MQRTITIHPVTIAWLEHNRKPDEGIGQVIDRLVALHNQPDPDAAYERQRDARDVVDHPAPPHAGAHEAF